MWHLAAPSRRSRTRKPCRDRRCSRSSSPTRSATLQDARPTPRPRLHARSGAWRDWLAAGRRGQGSGRQPSAYRTTAPRCHGPRGGVAPSAETTRTDPCPMAIAHRGENIRHSTHVGARVTADDGQRAPRSCQQGKPQGFPLHVRIRLLDVSRAFQRDILLGPDAVDERTY